MEDKFDMVLIQAVVTTIERGECQEIQSDSRTRVGKKWVKNMQERRYEEQITWRRNKGRRKGKAQIMAEGMKFRMVNT